MSQSRIHITIKTPESTLFDGDADALSSFNMKGPLDILASHENFISIIEKEVVVHDKGNDKTFPLASGILKIVENEVIVLLGVKTDVQNETPQKVAKK